MARVRGAYLRGGHSGARGAHAARGEARREQQLSVLLAELSGGADERLLAAGLGGIMRQVGHGVWGEARRTGRGAASESNSPRVSLADQEMHPGCGVWYSLSFQLVQAFDGEGAPRPRSRSYSLL